MKVRTHVFVGSSLKLSVVEGVFERESSRVNEGVMEVLLERL